MTQKLSNGLKDNFEYLTVNVVHLLQIVSLMNIPEIPLAQSLLQIFKAKNIQHIIISPGSRNAPLTIGFVSDPFFTCYSVADERSAAFFAMGIAQQLQKPTAVVCTSGSAVLNYYPAVAEAFYSQIPLLVVSADRPTNKIDIGDGQTIRQENVLSNHTLFNANLSDEASTKNDYLIQQAIDKCIEEKGPVHINIPFEEPLYTTLEEYTYTPTIIDFPKEEKLNVDTLPFTEIWKNANKKLILIGAQLPNSLSEEVINLLANDSSTVVLTEVTSNVHHSNFIPHIDTLITSFTEEDFKNFQPDLLITVGGMVVSKRIKAFLRKYSAKNHWHVDELRAYNTFGYLTAHIVDSPNHFFQSIYKNLIYSPSDYQSKYLKILNNKLKKHQTYLADIEYSDLKVFEIISQYIPQKSSLHISNSAGIRYAMLFTFNPTIEVFCNRGTSGIDGCTSTAVGSAVVTNKTTTLITGDISFLYDSNALWNNYIPKNFKIIIINNGGGGIFRILPGHQENKVFNTFFETEHSYSAQYLANMFHLHYASASNEIEVTEELKKMYSKNDKPCILEIFTPTKENQNIQRDYFKNV